MIYVYNLPVSLVKTKKMISMSMSIRRKDIVCMCVVYVNGVCVLSHFNHIRLFVTLWTVAQQALLSTGFPRQEYCSGLPGPPPGDVPDPGIKFSSLIST